MRSGAPAFPLSYAWRVAWADLGLGLGVGPKRPGGLGVREFGAKGLGCPYATLATLRKFGGPASPSANG